jgi:hypothetical protein
LERTFIEGGVGEKIWTVVEQVKPPPPPPIILCVRRKIEQNGRTRVVEGENGLLRLIDRVRVHI